MQRNSSLALKPGSDSLDNFFYRMFKPYSALNHKRAPNTPIWKTGLERKDINVMLPYNKLGLSIKIRSRFLEFFGKS